MATKPKRSFTEEQKAEAVKIVEQSGKSVSQVAREMGLTEGQLSHRSHLRGAESVTQWVLRMDKTTRIQQKQGG